jgi:tetratricopeptide (TPR) repeat protein
MDTLEAAASVVDTARPWPGLDAFTEVLSPFFSGRDAEADELFRRVRRDLVTLLFGQSGLGKTSLLQAGLFPRLRRARFLPILIRVDYSAGAPSPAVQIKASIERELAATDLSEVTRIGAEESLWGYFHHVDRRLMDRAGKEIVPVLVFDQFEEVFTQGLADSNSRAASQSFLVELAELAENRPSEALERAIEADPNLVENFLFDRQDYRIVVALREDFLAALDSLRSRAPSLGRNRYRLRPMSGRQGLDAILNPAPGLVAPDVAQEIIRLIGRPTAEDVFGTAGNAAEGFEVEPSLLSLVCRELNERRIARGLDQIGAELLAGSRDEIIEVFYERCLAGQPAALRAFVEDRLLSDSGFRENITLDSARRVLSDDGVPPGALDELVRRRLLRTEERLGIPRIEIIHDVLTPVIRKSRDTRRLRQAEAAASEREAALHRERRRARRAYWLSAAMALLALVTIGVAWWGWSSKLEAERQRAAAEEQRTFAEQQRSYAEQQRTLAEEQRKIAEVQSTAANDASKRAERSLTLATQTADGLIFDIAQRFRNVAGVPAATIKGLLDSARKLQDQLAAGGESSPELRRSQAEAQMEMANSLLTAGDTAAALTAAQQAQTTFQDLVISSPNSTDFQRELSVSHNKIGDVLVAAGKREEALAAYRKALAISDKLAAAEPDNTESQRDLSICHNKIGDVLVAAGKREEALAAYQKALAIRDKLAAAEPDNTELQRDLSVSQSRIGDLLVAAGKREEALAAYQKALSISGKLAAAEPDNTELQRDLSIGHEKIGDLLAPAGKREEALAAYQKDLAIADKLAAADLGNTQWQRDLSVSHEKIGDVLLAAGKREEALVAHQKSLAIRAKLAAADPGNTQWQRDLSISHEKIGDVLLAARKREEALAAYQKMLAIREKLAAADPGNTEWQRDLSISHDRIGDVLLAAGKREEALAAYQKSLAVDKVLARRDLGNAQWQSDLSWVVERISAVAHELHDPNPMVESAVERVDICRLRYASVQSDGNKSALAEALGAVSYELLFVHRSTDALAAAKEALSLDPSAVWVETNRAHALLFLGRFDEARAVYLEHQDQPLSDARNFAQMVKADFVEFRKFGIDTPEMKRIEVLLPQDRRISSRRNLKR